MHVYTGCQWQPSDSGVIADGLLRDKLVHVAPPRLKWTSPALVRVNMCDVTSTCVT